MAKDYYLILGNGFTIDFLNSIGNGTKNNIDVSLPGQAQLAIQLGIKSMQLQVVGLDQVVAQQAANNHPSSHGCTLGAIH